MNVLLIVAVGAGLLVIASRTYPFWIERIFGISDDTPPPSEEFADGVDYVKSPTQLVFAHHFASIAGAGPILGPIIALAYGWGPAWLWIVFGGIFYGAVHDMSAMCVSVREGGRTIAEIARRTLGRSGYLLFVAFLLLVLSIVNAIFLKLSAAALTSAYPVEHLGDGADTLLRTYVDAEGVTRGRIGGIATMSVVVMTFVAPLLGYLVNRRHLRGGIAFLVAAGVCVLSILVGFHSPIFLDDIAVRLGTSADVLWQIMLSVYVFIACWVPVWLLLQPRDYMNVQVLYGGIALLVVATIAAGLQGATPQVGMNLIAEAKGPIWPMMFITIACGAISGFHALVATGTTVKQIPRATDCRRVGYNAMLLESFLALLVLIAVASQLSPTEYMSIVHPELGRGNPILAFALGAGQLFTSVGIPLPVACVLGILIIEGFLVTTLDTAIRLGRYLFEELWGCLCPGGVPAALRHPALNTALAVALMLVFALSQDAYKALWPYFGAGNQLIGALTLTTVTVWLLRRGRTAWFVAIPAVFMVVTAMTALALRVRTEFQSIGDASGRVVVAIGGIVLLSLGLGFVIVATLQVWTALRGVTRGPS